MAKSPMVEAAVVVLETANKELAFNELFDKVVKELQLDKKTATSKIAKLYSDITLDGRFISLPDNKWDLKKHHKLDDIKKVINDTIIDDEDELDYEDEDGAEIELSLDPFSVVKDDKFDDDIKGFKELASKTED